MDSNIFIGAGLVLALGFGIWALKSDVSATPTKRAVEPLAEDTAPTYSESSVDERWSGVGTLLMFLGIAAVAVGVMMESTVSSISMGDYGVSRSERIINFDLMFQKFIIIFLGSIAALMGLICRAVGALLTK